MRLYYHTNDPPTFIDEHGTVYDEYEGLIYAPPDRPAYLPDPDRDPVGFRRDMELAAAIRKLRAEGGIGGQDAYAAAYRGMCNLHPDDPVPPLSDLPWRRPGQRALDQAAGLPTIPMNPRYGEEPGRPVIDTDNDTFYAALPLGPYDHAYVFTADGYRSRAGDLVRLTRTRLGEEGGANLELLTMAHLGTTLDGDDAVEAAAYADTATGAMYLAAHGRTWDVTAVLGDGQGIDHLMEAAWGETFGWSVPEVDGLPKDPPSFTGLRYTGASLKRVAVVVRDVPAVRGSGLLECGPEAAGYFGVSEDPDNALRPRIRARDETVDLRARGGIGL